MMAIFVDGVGQVSEMEIAHEYPRFSFAISPSVRVTAAIDCAPSNAPLAEFHRIGRLPDGRTVYGFLFETEPLTIWTIENTWSCRLSEEGVACVMQDMQKQIDQMGRRPRVILTDVTTELRTTAQRLRRVLGVARHAAPRHEGAK